MSTLNKSQLVKALFEEIDAHTHQFAGESKITCPSGCGHCCENPKIETSVADMLPLAFALKEKGTLNEAASRAEVSQNAPCIFFEKLYGANKGRCTVYPYRPSICRLFGFAAVHDKNGDPQLAACKIHKAIQKQVVENAKTAIELGHLKAPMFTDYADKLSEIDPTLAIQYHQINKALLVAIEKVALLPS